MQSEFRYADLMNDDVFKLVFGQESSKDVMIEFLNRVIEEPVTFLIGSDCRRRPDRPDIPAMKEDRWLRNFGSNKYRLKLTDYQ